MFKIPKDWVSHCLHFFIYTLISYIKCPLESNNFQMYILAPVFPLNSRFIYPAARCTSEYGCLIGISSFACPKLNAWFSIHIYNPHILWFSPSLNSNSHLWVDWAKNTGAIFDFVSFLTDFISNILPILSLYLWNISWTWPLLLYSTTTLLSQVTKQLSSHSLPAFILASTRSKGDPCKT